MTGATAVNPVLQKHREWAEMNPLLVWRLSQTPKVSRMEASALLGVSAYAVYTWEAGSSRPNENSMDRISGLLGLPARTIWDAWEGQRP